MTETKDNIRTVSVTPTPRQSALINCPADTIFWGGSRGGGKASHVSDSVITPYGFQKIGDLKIGDLITGRNGKPQEVIGVYDQGVQDIYAVMFEDGGKTRCTLDHLWLVKRSDRSGWRVWTFGMIKDYLDSSDGSVKIGIPLCDAVEFCNEGKDAELPIQADVLGTILGGKLGGEHTLKIVQSLCDKTELECKEVFIPMRYRLASVKARREMLKSLFLLGSRESKPCSPFYTGSKTLAKDAQSVAWSLGFMATVTEIRKADATEYSVTLDNTSYRELFGNFKPSKKPMREIVSYEYVGKEEARCIAVSNPDSLYLAGDFCVTHNTYGAGLLMLDRATKYGDKLNAIFFRRTNSELEGAISEYQSLFSDTAVWRSGTRTFQFWNGASLKMRFIDSLDDTRKYQGHEYGLMIFDEVTNFDNWNWIQRLQACLRSTEIPTQCILSGNPGGPLHLKLKSEFINPYPQGGVLLRDQYSKSLGRWTYKCFLPSKLTDNPYLMNTSYEANLRKVGTPEQIRQWLDGDWSVAVNAAFNDLWSAPIHVVKPFKIPYTWEIWKSYDYGSLHPWGCVWFAISDGCDFIASDGSVCPTTPGDIFAVRELYGRTEEENVGDQAPIEAQALQINHVEETFFRDRTIAHSLADSAIFARNSGYCIADEFEKYGVYWERCTKYPGSREHGFVLLRERLLHSLKRNGEPGIFWFQNCVNSIRTIPELRMEKDGTDRVATGNSSEDHLYDLHCYMLLAQDYGKAGSAATGNY